ncbi:MAG: sulfotransferase [Bacteroidales bacterium]|nr:sulfotransferase [Bacteroidales bacterium]
MKYIFLSYLNRSGSTLLANMLSRSPDICVCPEADILYKLFLKRPEQFIGPQNIIKYKKTLSGDTKFRLWDISSENLLRINRSNLQNFLAILDRFRETHYPSSSCIVFKQNYLYKLSETSLAGNEFYFINLLRDPRAIFASQKTTVSPATGKAMCRNIFVFARSWNSYIDGLEKISPWKKSISVTYENLVTETEITLEKLCRFFGYSNWVLNMHRKTELSRWLTFEYKNIHTNIDSPPYAGSLNKWKAILKQSEVFALSVILKEFGFYSFGFSGTEGLKLRLSGLYFKACYFLWKYWFSVLGWPEKKLIRLILKVI